MSQPQEPRIGPVHPSYRNRIADEQVTTPGNADCLYADGEDTPGVQAEIEHHLRFQTGTVHGAGRRIEGYRREPVLGELLASESHGIEGGQRNAGETE